jgi:hypothetical protein
MTRNTWHILRRIAYAVAALAGLAAAVSRAELPTYMGSAEITTTQGALIPFSGPTPPAGVVRVKYIQGATFFNGYGWFIAGTPDTPNSALALATADGTYVGPLPGSPASYTTAAAATTANASSWIEYEWFGSDGRATLPNFFIATASTPPQLDELYWRPNIGLPDTAAQFILGDKATDARNLRISFPAGKLKFTLINPGNIPPGDSSTGRPIVWSTAATASHPWWPLPYANNLATQSNVIDWPGGELVVGWHTCDWQPVALNWVLQPVDAPAFLQDAIYQVEVTTDAIDTPKGSPISDDGDPPDAEPGDDFDGDGIPDTTDPDDDNDGIPDEEDEDDETTPPTTPPSEPSTPPTTPYARYFNWKVVARDDAAPYADAPGFGDNGGYRSLMGTLNTGTYTVEWVSQYWDLNGQAWTGNGKLAYFEIYNVPPGTAATPLASMKVTQPVHSAEITVPTTQPIYWHSHHDSLGIRGTSFGQITGDWVQVKVTKSNGTPLASDGGNPNPGNPFDKNGNGNTTDPEDDADGDGDPNSTDPDDDNDNIPDATDPYPFTPDTTDEDDDNDGTPDEQDPDHPDYTPPTTPPADGDSDDDVPAINSVRDAINAFRIEQGGSTSESIADLLRQIRDATTAATQPTADSDFDGIPDNDDTDADGDWCKTTAHNPPFNYTDPDDSDFSVRCPVHTADGAPFPPEDPTTKPTTQPGDGGIGDPATQPVPYAISQPIPLPPTSQPAAVAPVSSDFPHDPQVIGFTVDAQQAYDGFRDGFSGIASGPTATLGDIPIYGDIAKIPGEWRGFFRVIVITTATVVSALLIFAAFRRR